MVKSDYYNICTNDIEPLRAPAFDPRQVLDTVVLASILRFLSSNLPG
jgi:hypothetical protein